MFAEMTDAALVQCIVDGQRDAEAEVCRRMGPRIRLYGLRHLRSAPAADDLVQHVLLKTLETLRAGRLRDADKLAPFVLGICRMTVLELRRSLQRQTQLLEEFGRVLISVQPDAAPLDGERLARCVGALKERDRSVVVMTYYDEISAIETGRSLGISEANVRVIRHRALKQLRTCMETA